MDQAASLSVASAPAADLPGMLATLSSYECLFGPYHLQTLTLAAQTGEALWLSGESDQARVLLEHAARHLARYGDRAADVRTRTLSVLRDLQISGVASRSLV